MYDLLSLIFGVWHMQDAKMYNLLSLFFGVWHMEDAKMYDLLSLFSGSGIWKILRCTICCL